MATAISSRVLWSIPLTLIAVLLIALSMTGLASAKVSLLVRGESGEMILGPGSIEGTVYYRHL